VPLYFVALFSRSKCNKRKNELTEEKPSVPLILEQSEYYANGSSHFARRFLSWLCSGCQIEVCGILSSIVWSVKRFYVFLQRTIASDLSYAFCHAVTFFFRIAEPAHRITTIKYCAQPVLPLCCYGKVPDFMIKTLDVQKKHEITKANLHTIKMPRKYVAVPIIDIVQLIVNQR